MKRSATTCSPRRRKQWGSWWLGAIALLCLLPRPVVRAAGLDAWHTEWGGHLRGIGTLTYPDDRSIYQFVDADEPFVDGQLELRLKNKVAVGSAWSLETHYELVGIRGDSTENYNQLRKVLPAQTVSTALGPEPIINDDRRVMNLTHILYRGDAYAVYHRLDRLYLKYAASWGTLRLGRQALTWGNGLIFNPMDLFNPFSPVSVQKDYKTGDDMLHFQIPAGQGDIQLLYLPRRDPSTGNIRDDQSSYAAKWHLTWKTLEMDFMAARHYGDMVLAAGAVGYLGEAAWRVDTLYNRLGDHLDRKDFWQLVANMDYAWLWFDKNIYGLIEFYFNGLGRRHGDYAQALTDPQLSRRLARGELFTLGRTYLAGQLQAELHPLLHASLITIVNLADPSTIMQPQLQWDATSDWQLIAGASLNRGGSDTEFGGFYTSLDETQIKVGPSDSIYLWLTYYF
jgi:hypothetical protein